MFKSEEAMKTAINAIEQGVGADRWGIGSFFEATEVDIVDGWVRAKRPKPGTSRASSQARCLVARLDRDRSCAIGLMFRAVINDHDTMYSMASDVSDIVREKYGLHGRDVEQIVLLNDKRGPDAVIRLLREEIGHVQK